MKPWLRSHLESVLWYRDGKDFPNSDRSRRNPIVILKIIRIESHSKIVTFTDGEHVVIGKLSTSSIEHLRRKDDRELVSLTNSLIRLKKWHWSTTFATCTKTSSPEVRPMTIKSSCILCLYVDDFALISKDGSSGMSCLPDVNSHASIIAALNALCRSMPNVKKIIMQQLERAQNLNSLKDSEGIWSRATRRIEDEEGPSWDCISSECWTKSGPNSVVGGTNSGDKGNMTMNGMPLTNNELSLSQDFYAHSQSMVQDDGETFQDAVQFTQEEFLGDNFCSFNSKDNDTSHFQQSLDLPQCLSQVPDTQCSIYDRHVSTERFSRRQSHLASTVMGLNDLDGKFPTSAEKEFKRFPLAESSKKSIKDVPPLSPIQRMISASNRKSPVENSNEPYHFSASKVNSLSSNLSPAEKIKNIPPLSSSLASKIGGKLSIRQKKRQPPPPLMFEFFHSQLRTAVPKRNLEANVMDSSGGRKRKPEYHGLEFSLTDILNYCKEIK